MSTRSVRPRPRTAASIPGPSDVAGSSTALPPYEPPTFSLNPTAQRALAQLAQANNLQSLDEHLSQAQATVSNAAADLNDRQFEAEKNYKKRKAPEEEDGVEAADVDEAQQSLEALREKVESLTQRMDESMRKLIDGQHGVQSIKDSVGSTAEFARVNASTQASTQARTRRRGMGEEGEEEDDDYEDFEPTDPAAGTQANRSAIDKFRKDLDQAKTKYQSHSMHTRYAENNEYKNFRSLVHDARYQDGDVQLEHHSRWFPEGERPAPGVTTRRARAEAEDADSDDDIAVSKASISTRCPLTLQEFNNPVTSTKCPHSFEQEAIQQMIAQSRPQPVVPNGRPEKAVQCPVSGCNKLLTKNDLHIDKVLVRKIKRLQEAARLEEEESDDEGGVEGTQRNATIVDDEDGNDVDDIVEGRVRGTQATEVKREVGRTQTQGRVPGTQGISVVDLGGSSDEEAEEEDEMEE